MRHLSVKDVAARTHRSPFTIYRWVASGLLPATKPAGTKSWIIREDDLDAFLAGKPVGWTVDEHVAAIVEGAPTLTPDQINRLRLIVGRRSA
jgi:excisionase family DNA binding protein